MITRKAEPRDFPVLQEIFRKQGFDYSLPDFGSTNIIAKRVLVDAHDVPVMGAIERVTTESFGFFDPGWETPGWRLAGFKILHASMQRELREKGITDTHCWIPPEIEKSFGRRLKKFGWVKTIWPSYMRIV